MVSVSFTAHYYYWTYIVYSSCRRSLINCAHHCIGHTLSAELIAL